MHLEQYLIPNTASSPHAVFPPCGSLSWLCGSDLLCCDPIYLFLFLFPVFGSHMKTLISPVLFRNASYICPSNGFILPGHGDRSFLFFDLF